MKNFLKNTILATITLTTASYAMQAEQPFALFNMENNQNAALESYKKNVVSTVLDAVREAESLSYDLKSLEKKLQKLSETIKAVQESKKPMELWQLNNFISEQEEALQIVRQAKSSALEIKPLLDAANNIPINFDTPALLDDIATNIITAKDEQNPRMSWNNDREGEVLLKKDQYYFGVLNTMLTNLHDQLIRNQYVTLRDAIRHDIGELKAEGSHMVRLAGYERIYNSPAIAIEKFLKFIYTKMTGEWWQ